MPFKKILKYGRKKYKFRGGIRYRKRYKRFKKSVKRIVLDAAETKRLVRTMYQGPAAFGGTAGKFRNMEQGRGVPISDQFLLKVLQEGSSYTGFIGREVYLRSINLNVNYVITCPDWTGSIANNWLGPITPGNQVVSYHTRIILARTRKGINTKAAGDYLLNSTWYSDVGADPFQPLGSNEAAYDYEFDQYFKIVKHKKIVHQYTVGTIWNQTTGSYAPSLQACTGHNITFRYKRRLNHKLKFNFNNNVAVFDEIPNDHNYWLFGFTTLPPTFIYARSGYMILKFKDNS